MTVAVQTNDQKGMLAIDITGTTSTDNGGIGSVLNPEGCDLVITRTYIHARTGSTGAANLDVGIGASAATKATDILSTFDMIEATIGGKVFYCQAVPVNETEEAVIWEDGEYLTITGSATSVGLDATLYVEYLRLDA